MLDTTAEVLVSSGPQGGPVAQGPQTGLLRHDPELAFAPSFEAARAGGSSAPVGEKPRSEKVEGLFEFNDYDGPIVESCDYLIIGSGPGGATLARSLAGKGKVIVVEAGPWLRRADYLPDGGKMLSRYMWDGGMRMSMGNVIMPTLQPRCLGGGSVFNAAICMRAADSALEQWAEASGVQGLLAADLAPWYDEVEAFMGVRPAQKAVMGRRNELFAEAANQLGWKPEPLPRMESGCIGSGECVTGCRVGGKNSTDKRGIPELLAAGGQVFTSVKVDRLVVRNGRVDGIEGHVVAPIGDAASHPVRIAARCTILAGGALNTPQIAQRSGLTRAPIGANLRFHPSGFVVGFFDEDVDPTFGATQGYHVLDFIDQGIKLESLWAPYSVFVRRFPLMGKAFQRYLQRYQRMAVWDCWVSGDASMGRVSALSGRQRISYSLEAPDQRRLQEAHVKLAEMFFAVGAKEILPGLGNVPEVVRNAPDAARSIREARLQVTDFQTASNHVFGTMQMGNDPEKHATDSWGKVYGVEDLYVADTSLFPSSPAANPQLTAMALARRLGEALPDRYDTARNG